MINWIKKFLGFGIPSIGGISLATLSSSNLTLPQDYPYSKHLDVYFYDNNGNNNNPIIIRLWIEDVNSGKVQYSENNNNDNKNFKPLSSSEENNKKYLELTKLARTYVQTQHYLNLIKAFRWGQKIKNNSENNNFEISNCCKKKCNCKDKDMCATCVCCYSSKCKETNCNTGNENCDLSDLNNTQLAFYFHLNNWISSYENSYLTPVQAHIKLIDTNINSDFSSSSSSSSSSSKRMVGTMVYGFLNYQYKETSFNKNSDFIKTIFNGNTSNIFSNIFSNNSDSNEKKYFANIPQSFSFQLNNNNVQEISNSETSEDINSIWKNLQNKEEVNKLIKEKEISSCKDECCCCEDASKCKKTLECILNRNWAWSFSQLTDAQSKVKDLKNCCSK